MMARRGEAVWQAPHNEPQRGQRVRQALPKGASRFSMARSRSVRSHCHSTATSLPFTTSEALCERDLIRGSLVQLDHWNGLAVAAPSPVHSRKAAAREGAASAANRWPPAAASLNEPI